MLNKFTKLMFQIYNHPPREILSKIMIKIRKDKKNDYEFDLKRKEYIENELINKFSIFKADRLKNETPENFRGFLENKIGKIDTESEGYSEQDIDRQRDLSIKFNWGHNHDFGDFYLRGRMGDRHIKLIRNFCCIFGLSLEYFSNKQVLDIGCWTGGTTLLLNALGSRVVAIEEVKKYADVVSFLANAFGINENVDVISNSLYSCNNKKFYDRFDIVYFPGVIYHLSDPLIALRILYNTCRLDGIILVESMGINVPEPYCRFAGSYIYGSGEKEKLNRGGWNWFIPSPSALYRMLKEAGFDDIKTTFFEGRVYGYAKKVAEIGICRAGLSMPDIK